MRKMAHVELIEEVLPAENADNLERIRVLGWWGVARKGTYSVGDKVIALEYDSILPEIEYFSFMKEKKYKVRTARLRGNLSEFLPVPYADILVIFQQLVQKDQGVLVPIERLGISKSEYEVGDDLTDILQIKKYEPFIECCGSGEMKGAFPSFIKPTDEPRIEGLEGMTLYNELLGQPYYITVKMDGQSGTFYLKDNEFGVCSRTTEYRYLAARPNNWWYCAKKQEIEEWLRVLNAINGHDWCIQGEVCGPKIQENKLKLKEPTMFMFNLIDLTERRRLSWNEIEVMLGLYPAKFETVPLFQAGVKFDLTKEQLYELADGYYPSGERREGLVIRHADNIKSKTLLNEPLSFKVISKKFLLKEK
jgi:RNA ligase (TIGR02306 family)